MRKSPKLRWGSFLIFVLLFGLVGASFNMASPTVLAQGDETPRPTPTDEGRPTVTPETPTVETPTFTPTPETPTVETPTFTPTPETPTFTPTPGNSTVVPTDVPTNPEEPGPAMAPPPAPTATPFVATRLPHTGLFDSPAWIPMSLAILILLGTLIAARTLREHRDDDSAQS